MIGWQKSHEEWNEIKTLYDDPPLPPPQTNAVPVKAITLHKSAFSDYALVKTAAYSC